MAILPFTLHLEDGVPVSDQILLAVRRAMLTGQLKAGDAFPSVRTLSQELRISPTTAHKVVLALKSAGWLAARPGVGMVVTAPKQPAVADRIEQLLPACRQLLEQADELNLTLEQAIKALRQARQPVNTSKP